jgi:hypothetical protein
MTRSTVRSIALLCVVAVAVGGLALWAGARTKGSESFNPNRTRFLWTGNEAQTTSTSFTATPDLGHTAIKHHGELIATYTVKLRGQGPAQFRLPGDGYKPNVVTFDPSASRGSDTFSFTAVLPEDGWECSQPQPEWRSPTGARLTISFMNMVVEYERKNVEPDYACREGS